MTNSDGTPVVDDVVTERYWSLKNGGTTQLQSGWKIWDGENMYAKMRTPVEINYAWRDLGFTDPNIEPSSSEDDPTDIDTAGGETITTDTPEPSAEEAISSDCQEGDSQVTPTDECMD